MQDQVCLAAETQEAAGLNFAFDRLNARVSSLKQTLKLYYKTCSPSLVRLQIKTILYSANE